MELLLAAEVKPEQLDGLSTASWIDLGFGGWRLEYISAETTFFKDWLAEDYPEIILNPAP